MKYPVRQLVVEIPTSLIAILFTFLACHTLPAQVDFFWDNATGGAFNDPLNWQSVFPGSLPDVFVRTNFDLPNSYTVNFASHELTNGTTVRDGSVTFDLGGHTYQNGELRVGDAADDVAELRLRNGILDPARIVLGAASPSLGAVVVGDGATAFSESVRIGERGGGWFSIENGGRLVASGIRLGDEFSANGTLNVSGADSSGNRSRLTGSDMIIVGVQGRGEMRITDGALVETNPNPVLEQDDVIGLFPAPNAGLGATGLVTVDGVGADGSASTWVSSGHLRIGNNAGDAFARGSMIITAGGQVSHTSATMLGPEQLTSSVEIRGTDHAGIPSKWKLRSGSLDVGAGEVLIADGGTLDSAGGIIIGQLAGHAARVTVTGTNSQGLPSRYDGGGVTVGANGAGEFNVNHGAVVSAPGNTGNLFIGTQTTGNGIVLIGGRDQSGNPASVTMGRTIVIGQEGSAALTVSDGGQLTTGFDYELSFGAAALRETAETNITITGAGSNWSHANTMYLGGGASAAAGSAIMTIDDLASVDIGRTLKIWHTSAVKIKSGTLSVDVLELTEGSTLEFGIQGLQPSIEYGHAVLSDDALLDGYLQIKLADAFTPRASDTFTLLDGVDVMGVFENVVPGGRLLTTNRTGSFRVDYGIGSPFGSGQVVISDFTLNSLILVDFNDDGVVDTGDANALVAEIAAATHEALFDVTGDGAVDGADLDAWLMQAGEVNLPSGNSYLAGDANLDGFVDGLDFVSWNTHKFTSTAAWSAGDFNADGLVDGRDAVIWNSNKFLSADWAGTKVPEPTFAVQIGCWLLSLTALRAAYEGCEPRAPTNS